MTSPGQLKLELATRGIQLDSSVVSDAALTGPMGPRRTIDLVLPHQACVTAPIVESSSLVLMADGDRRVVTRRNDHEAAERVPVRALPLPRFYERRTSAGTRMGRIATVQGRHLLVHPAAACGFTVRGTPCRFCVEGARGTGTTDAASVPEVLEVVRAAFDERVCGLVYFNTAAYDGEDGGIAFLAPYIDAVRRHFDTLVAVQVHPPRDARWVDRTYAMGVDAVSYNLEIFDPEVLNRQCIGRVRYIGRERYLDAMARAATVFPSGTVWCDLVLGLEPPESTMAGIDALAAAGVVPVISIARGDTPVGDAGTVGALGPVLAHLYHTVRRHGIAMGWMRDMARAITPLEARHFAGQGAPMAVAVQQLSRLRLGGVAARGLARMRRRLRVRKAGDASAVDHS